MFCTQMKSDIIRYDYLVSNVIINGTDYSVDMTVEVYGGQNKFKTYLLKDIEMTPTSSLSENVHPSVATGPVPALERADAPVATGPVPALGESGASSMDNVAQNAASVNPSIMRASAQTAARGKRNALQTADPSSGGRCFFAAGGGRERRRLCGAERNTAWTEKKE